MAWNRYLYLALFFLLIGFTSSSSSSSAFLSYNVLRAGKLTGRSLLQGKKECPVNMEAQNYTILTSRCKGPQYPVNACCEALLEFLCPFVDQVNDMSTNCADTMFSYINLYGQYPSGLFANQCKGDKEGLSCDKALNSDVDKAENEKSAALSQSHIHSLPRLSSATFLLLFLYLLF